MKIQTKYRPKQNRQPLIHQAIIFRSDLIAAGL